MTCHLYNTLKFINQRLSYSFVLMIFVQKTSKILRDNFNSEDFHWLCDRNPHHLNLKQMTSKKFNENIIFRVIKNGQNIDHRMFARIIHRTS